MLDRGGISERREWIKEHAAPAVAGTAADVIDSDGKSLGSYWDVFFQGKKLCPSLVTKEYLNSGGEFPSPIWFLMFRKDFLKEVGPFDPSLRVCSDNEYWHRMLALAAIPCIDVPVARYRLHDGNLCGKIVDGVFRYAPEILAENLFLKLNREHHARQ